MCIVPNSIPSGLARLLNGSNCIEEAPSRAQLPIPIQAHGSNLTVQCMIQMSPDDRRIHQPLIFVQICVVGETCPIWMGRFEFLWSDQVWEFLFAKLKLFYLSAQVDRTPPRLGTALKLAGWLWTQNLNTDLRGFSRRLAGEPTISPSVQ